MNQLALFDYQQLDSETRIITQQRAGEIKTLMRSTAEAIMQVGEKLLEVQTRLGNGQFDAWLSAEFDWSRRTAYNFIGVFKEFRGRANFAQMDVATSALYLLAAPSTPAEVRDELLERAEAGERITHGDVKQAVSEAKARRQPALPTPPEPSGYRVVANPEAGPAPWEQPEPTDDDLPAWLHDDDKPQYQRDRSEVTVYCPECGESRAMETSRIDKGLRSGCANCHAITPADEWLKLPPMEKQYAVYPCHLCGERKISINAKANTVECEACGNTWDTVGDYHAERKAPPLSEPTNGRQLVAEPAPDQTVPGECPACGHRLALTHDEDGLACPKCGSRNPTELWASEATKPEPEPLRNDAELATAQYRNSIETRFGRLLRAATSDQLSEIDAWMDDLQGELDLEPIY